MNSFDYIDCRIKGDVFPDVPPYINPVFYEKICTAVSEEKELWIEYVDKQNNTTERKIHPEALGKHSTMWYLVGFCILRQDFRTFALDRIVNVRFTGKKALSTEYASRLKQDAIQLYEAMHRKKPLSSNYICSKRPSTLKALFAIFGACLFKGLNMKPSPRIGKNGRPLREPSRYKYH